MNAKEEIKKLQEQLDNLKAELDKPEFEVGDWVINEEEYCNGIHRITGFWKDSPGFTKGYGFNSSGQWNDFKGAKWDVNEDTRLATPTEIETALIKEAERRGFKKGVKYKGASYNWTEYIHGSLEYFKDGDVLTDGYGESVYKQGKWAEIVEDKVKFFDWDVDYTKSAVRIGNTSYPKRWLRNTKQLLDSLMEDDLDFYNISEVLTELEKLDLD